MSLLASNIFWIAAFIAASMIMLYYRMRLLPATVLYGALYTAYLFLGAGTWWLSLLLTLALATLICLNLSVLRARYISLPLLNLFRRMLPSMSNTEREALEAGSVWWEGELFSGKPNWKKLIEAPAPQLSAAEQAFLDGPVEQLCGMLNDWTINHEHADLTDEIYDFIHKHKFLGMIIPKAYGGLEFSASAQIAVLVKINAVNTVTANYISVPNSLGPGELLMKYGTEEQKSYYLPRLASGTDIPCFGLTAPRAGSDATSIPDTGIVCKDQYQGKETLGIRLNFEKRYITLAPVATVIGLAFRLYDPDHLIGTQEEYGITCALIPRAIPGLEIGRRHSPIGSPFLNGPLKGKDVFVPLDFIIGGQAMAGKGWRMLVECLSAGRGISLPSASLSGGKRMVAATSAYARIRKQFNTAIGNFEAIQSILARMAGKTYIMDAAIRSTGAAIDQGEEPAVASAILKYHCTEMGREIGNDAMDVHGGKAAIKGPNNYLASAYEVLPVAITVEGANILTRSLIIFGQGAIRCHPYIYQEMQATQIDDEDEALREFDKALFGHIGFTLSNLCRAFLMGLTHARWSHAPVHDATRRYYQQINRYSAAFALIADISMLTLGGALKFKEMLSARLGDALSMLYLSSMVLKHYQNQGAHSEDLPLLHWACRQLLYQLQEQLHLLLRNLPNRWASALLRLAVFPLGRSFNAPEDKLRTAIAQLLLNENDTRMRLLTGTYLTPHANNPVGRLNQLLQEAQAIEPLEKKLIKAAKQGKIINILGPQQIDDAAAKGVINEQEAIRLRDFDARVMEFIHVDDFAYGEIGMHPLRQHPRIAPVAGAENITEISARSIKK